MNISFYYNSLALAASRFLEQSTLTSSSKGSPATSSPATATTSATTTSVGGFFLHVFELAPSIESSNLILAPAAVSLLQQSPGDNPIYLFYLHTLTIAIYSCSFHS